LSFTLQPKDIKVINPTEYDHPKRVRFEWQCPQCRTGTTHGDVRSDTVAGICADPICIYCRVKNGEFRLNGGNFIRVIKPGVNYNQKVLAM
jgi:hypothetical protein